MYRAPDTTGFFFTAKQKNPSSRFLKISFGGREFKQFRVWRAYARFWDCMLPLEVFYALRLRCTVFRIRIGFSADPHLIQHFRSWWPILTKIYRRSATGEAISLKKEHQALQNFKFLPSWIRITIGNADPDLTDQYHGSMRIRIRNTGGVEFTIIIGPAWILIPFRKGLDPDPIP